jgi:hypothetical protein
MPGIVSGARICRDPAAPYRRERGSSARYLAASHAAVQGHHSVKVAEARQAHPGLTVALNRARRLQRDSKRSVEDDLVLDTWRIRQSQHDQRSRRFVRRLPDGNTARSVRGLYFDSSPVCGQRVMASRGGGHKRQIKERLSCGLSNGTDEVAIEWKLSAWMHLLKLLDDRMELIDQLGSPPGTSPVVRRGSRRFPAGRVIHGLILP